MEEVLSKILTKFNDNVDLFLKVTATFSFHYIYRLKFKCPRGSLQFCTVYLLAPCLIIWILLLAIDKTFVKSVARFVKEECSRSVSLYNVLSRLLLTFCVSLIWTVSVLVDGDWFVCCEEFYGNKSASPVSDSELRTTSWIYGMYLLLGTSMLLLLPSCIKAFIKDLKYFEILLEEEESGLEKKVRQAMRNKADQELKDPVEQGDWREVSDRGEEVYRWRTSKKPQKEPPGETEPSETGYESNTETDGATGVRDGPPHVERRRRRSVPAQRSLEDQPADLDLARRFS